MAQIVIRPRRRWNPIWFIWTGLFGLAFLACLQLNLFNSDNSNAFDNAREYLARYFPPDVRAVKYYLPYIWETISIAIWGTFLGFLISAVSTVWGARNFTPNLFAYRVTRVILAMCRTLPSVIIAVVFVAAFGPGPLAGVATLTIHTVGYLGRQWNDSLERVSVGLDESLAAAGASNFQRLRFGGWPASASEVWGYTLFAFDMSLRQAAILGSVGAGGIGMELSVSLRLFDFRRAAIIILLIMAIILVNESISVLIRKRLN